MLRALRSLGRPVGVILLALLVSPSMVADCRPIGEAAAADMPCCHKASRVASFDAECCAVRPDSSSEHQPPLAPQLRSTDGKDFLTNAPPAAAAVPAPPVPVPDSRAGDPPVPQDHLYLRHSAIRC